MPDELCAGAGAHADVGAPLRGVREDDDGAPPRGVREDDAPRGVLVLRGVAQAPCITFETRPAKS